jgi:phosphopantothenoylcysteine decarboxylase/phosphopantothenate--cysteine ligase
MPSRKSAPQNLTAPTFLITAGPTIEDIDPVRFLSNRSSGLMGVEIARAAVRQGCRVILIHGPLAESVRRAIPKSPHLQALPVRSADDMHKAVMEHVPAADVVVMNAAVADYTPVRQTAAKLKKSAGELSLRLKPTVDILKTLGELKSRRQRYMALVGFALETGSGATEAQRHKSRLAEARRKLRAKNLDAIVLDTPAAMGAERSDFTVLPRAGQEKRYRMATKRMIARAVVELCEQLRAVPWLERFKNCFADICRLNIRFARAMRAEWLAHKEQQEKWKVLLACSRLERDSRHYLRVLKAGHGEKLRLLRAFLRNHGELPR